MRTISSRAAATDARVRELEIALRAHGTPTRAQGAKAYLKSDLEFYGVDSPTLSRVVREFGRAHPSLDRAELLALVRALWTTRVHELRSAAIALLEANRRILNARDLPLLERLARESRSWAYVDWLATRIIAPLIEADPRELQTVRRWARDGDFWIRRTALLALLPALKRGDGDFDLFARLADPMMQETEFFIRKAIGWVLREVSKKRPELTAAFLARHATTASGVTWREGIKYLPAAHRRRLGKRRAVTGTTG